MEITSRQTKLLGTEAVAFASINEDGSPNLIAVGYAKVVSPSEIIITDNFMKHTPENIKRDPRVCLAVWTKDWEEGYKFVGKAEYYSSGKWFEFIKQMKENKGCPAKGAILIKVEFILKLG